MTDVQNSPFERPIEDVVRDHINQYVSAMDILINNRTIPAFDGSIDVNESDSAEIKQYAEELAQFLEDNDLPSDWTPEKVEESEGKFFIDGEVYEDSNEWINAEFVDFAYHRFHNEINVIQCLTMCGGPTGGFWIEEDGSIQYWIAWGFDHHSISLSGSDYATVKAFFESEFECHSFEFECDHGVHSIDDQWGFEGATTMLRSARYSKEFEEESEEESEEEGLEDAFGKLWSGE